VKPGARHLQPARDLREVEWENTQRDFFPTIPKELHMKARIAAALCLVPLLGALAALTPASAHAQSEKQFALVKPGESADEVKSLIGSPDGTESFTRAHRKAWDYRFIDAWGNDAQFSVTFDSQGRVLSTFTQRSEGD
jgi:outer membrane protein assembly factor BamE (lipoprotein component of BamABCDE complex)